MRFTFFARVRHAIFSLLMAALIFVEPLAAQESPDTDEPSPPDVVAVPDIPPVPQEEAEIDAYLVDAFVFRFLEEHPGHLDLETFQDVEVVLSETATGYIAPREGFPLVRFTLRDVTALEQQAFYFSGLQAVFTALVEHLQANDLIGVYVFPDPEEIQQGTGIDLRAVDNNSLTILIVTAIIQEIRTLAFGERIPDEQRENNEVHRGIIARSPLKIWDNESPRQDLLRRDVLDDYLALLNRLPGRRVDAAISAATDQPGGVVLDFLVAENNPLMLYTQISNTGTKDTDRLRERFGFIRNQFTDNDDILSLEYVTATFDTSNAFIGSYEAPVSDSRILRWGVSGSWSEFTASDVGFANEEFTGDSWFIDGSLRLNVYQHKEFFLDVVGGAKWMFVHINNEVVDIEGESDFFLPHIGIQFERHKKVANTDGFIQFEWNLPDVAGTDKDELNALGRLFPEEDWTALHWDIRHSFFLEPLLNAEAWRNIDEPESSTLAHEIFLSFKGQYAFDNRLIPQAEQVIGGLYSVRGYPESVVAGDNVYVGTLEYRFHIPKSFPYDAEPGVLFGRPFRTVPQEPYGSADWDLILKAFLDYGVAEISEPFSFEESSRTLMSTGVGFELSILRNVNLRLDWGFVMKELDGLSVNSGSNRAQFVATFVF